MELDPDDNRKRRLDDGKGGGDGEERPRKRQHLPEEQKALDLWSEFQKEKEEQGDDIVMVSTDELAEAEKLQTQELERQRVAHTGVEPFVFKPLPGIQPLTPEEQAKEWAQFEAWLNEHKGHLVLHEANGDSRPDEQHLLLSDEELERYKTGNDVIVTPLLGSSSVIDTGGETTAATSSVNTPQPLRIHFMDVGQGNGTLIECPHGELILFDFGTAKGKSTTSDLLISFIKRKGSHLHYLLISHADKDHINLLPLLKDFAFGKVICGGKVGDYKATDGKKLVDVLKEKAIKLEDCIVKEGNIFSESPELDRGSRKIQCKDVDIFIAVMNSPLATIDEVRNLRPESERNEPETTIGTVTNSASMVLVIKYGDKQVFLSADATFSTDHFLLNSQECQPWKGKLKSYAMSGGHHGAKFSFSEALLKELDPEWVHFSADLHDGFKHPTWQVIQRILKNCPKVRPNRPGDFKPAFGPHGIVVGHPGEVDASDVEPLEEAIEGLGKIKIELQKTLPQASWKHALLGFALDLLRQREGTGGPERLQPEEPWLQEVMEEVAVHVLLKGKGTSDLLSLADTEDMPFLSYWSGRLAELAKEQERLDAQNYKNTPWHWFSTSCNIFTSMEDADQGVYWVLEIDAQGKMLTMRT